MDYQLHNNELEFKLLLRQRLTRNGIGSVMDEVVDELRALAEFLEDSSDYPAAAKYRAAANSIEEAADDAVESLNEK